MESEKARNVVKIVQLADAFVLCEDEKDGWIA